MSNLMTYMIIFEPLTAAQALALLVSLFQTLLIASGLWMMHRTSQSRNRQLDQQDRKLDLQQEALHELSRKTDQQREEFDRHMVQQERKTDLQQEALQELLRRTA